jgi:ketosteroid isomerase-like protein
MVETITRYYEACNAANVDKMRECFATDAVHYFPAGAPQGTFRGADAIARGWRKAVERLDSRWTIDRFVLDELTFEAAIEWTHWKPNQRTRLRGAELFCFAPNGLISEIRAYYAAPAHDPPVVHELGDFDYAGRGYPMTAPDVRRSST